MKRLVDWLFWSEGSTRAVALVRIGLALLLWDRFAADMLLFRARDALEAGVALSFFAATTLLFLGLWTRVAAAWTAATMLVLFAVIGLNRGFEPYEHHHVFLLVAATVLLALTPSGASFSVDRWIAVSRAAARGDTPPAERGPLYGQRLLAMLISSVYLFAVYDKLSPAFLSGERLQHVLLDRYGTSAPPPVPGFEVVCLLGAWGTVAMETALAVGLWVPRIQRPLMVAGTLFHGMLYVMLPVGPFSLTMVLLYLAFLDPAVVHRVTARLVGTATPGTVGAA